MLVFCEGVLSPVQNSDLYNVMVIVQVKGAVAMHLPKF